MAITPNAFRPARQLPEDLALRRLSSADVPAIEALLQGGGPFAPDAFNPSQVRAGVFFGGERGASLQPEQHGLLAVAGTHLVAPTRGVAAVGNIYTHPAHRGHGYGQLVTSAVTEELLNRRLLVVLNVNADNASAVHMYKKLGYRVHCPFVEGKGRRRTKNGKQDATVHDPPSNDEIGTILTDRSRHRSEEVITT
jgi:predicted GNAT family acetyltransferase